MDKYRDNGEAGVYTPAHYYRSCWESLVTVMGAVTLMQLVRIMCGGLAMRDLGRSVHSCAMFEVKEHGDGCQSR